MSAVEDKLRELGYSLPPPPLPGGNYVPAVKSGNLVFLSGVVPKAADGSLMIGKVGRDFGIEEAQEAARLAALNLLANLKAAIGDLDKVNRVVKVLGMVNSTPDFSDHPKVMNGCSDLLVSVFGERGRHARSAVGMAALPSNVALEIEMIVEAE